MDDKLREALTHRDMDDHHSAVPFFRTSGDAERVVFTPFPRSMSSGDLAGFRLGPRKCYHFVVRELDADDRAGQ